MYPILFQNSRNNKTKQWSVHVCDNIITVSHGYIDGIITTNSKIITSGKNIGKINETTPVQQALKEAKSKWDKKITDGYHQITENEGIDILPITKSCFPMLALDYTKRSHNITFPAYVQPKIDGCRALYINGKFYSRNTKLFHNIPFNINTLVNGKEIILDGELYSDDISFEELVGIIKKEKCSPDDAYKIKSLKFMVYDIVETTLPYKERYQLLKSLTLPVQSEILLTEICESPDDIPTFHEKYTSDGYEGLIIRNISGLYREKYRSPDLQKYKHFLDEEFKIVDFKQGEGLEQGCVIWICETSSNVRFNVRPKGTRPERSVLFGFGKKYIGKFLTVKFQNFTDDGIPRFPVGIVIRDYE